MEPLIFSLGDIIGAFIPGRTGDRLDQRKFVVDEHGRLRRQPMGKRTQTRPTQPHSRVCREGKVTDVPVTAPKVKERGRPRQTTTSRESASIRLVLLCTC
jgi:hypothetical protein